MNSQVTQQLLYMLTRSPPHLTLHCSKGYRPRLASWYQLANPRRAKHLCGRLPLRETQVPAPPPPGGIRIT